jgi:predicted unusual protein kinase regulating ubiquinone biosynthesis (AarF/ABC1/UbiB family)
MGLPAVLRRGLGTPGGALEAACGSRSLLWRRRDAEKGGVGVQAHQRNAPVLVSLCRQNGGVYVKAGQLASELRAIPQQYRDAFKSLQVQPDPQKVANRNAKDWREATENGP